MFGLLPIDKPAGITSRDAVNRVQRLVWPVKVGHSGTLDPIATGLLLVCLGQATRLVDHLHRMPKDYHATFLLGRRSPSDDVELPSEELPGAPVPTRAEVECALPRFVGELTQVPPAYSAIKVRGEKAYNLARAGRAPDLAPRGVTVHALSVARYDYPELVLDVLCGAGTYIRALGRDLAAALGTAAVMSELRRTAIGPFRVERAASLVGLSQEGLRAALRPAVLAVADLPQLRVSSAEAVELRHGRFLSRQGFDAQGPVAAIGPDGELVALVRVRPDGKLGATHNFTDLKP